MVSVRKIAACVLVGTLSFAGHAQTARAAETPVAGIDLLLSDLDFGSQSVDTGLQTVLQTTSNAKVNDLAFAKVDNYVNIRSEASEDSKILGKLYKNNAATLLNQEEGWYKVKSGSVTGYIKSEFLLTGDQAEEYSEKIGITYATVTTATLRVRGEASLDSSVISLIPGGEDYKVLKEEKEWVKISIDNNNAGYVSKDYVTLNKEYDQAISIEEEQAKLQQEAEAAARTARLGTASSSSTAQKSSANKMVKSSSVSESKSVKTQTSNSSSLRNRVVDYALKFEGNPYSWGGTSLTRGADCSGFTQSVLKYFGISIPRTSRAQAASGKRVDIDNIKPGDLIFYRKNGVINHVALYIGNGKVISAKSKGEGIRITSYNYRTPYKAVSYIS